jgi:hypothetical protein
MVRQALMPGERHVLSRGLRPPVTRTYVRRAPFSTRTQQFVTLRYGS